jgi:YHS domain-containing protein
MLVMRTMLFLALLVCAAGAAVADDDGAPLTGRVSDRSRICMMQDSVQPKPGVAHEYQGKTYWLCCEMCVQSFGADPEKFAHATDPVTGDVVDKATAPVYAVNGKAYFFGSEQSLDRFAKEPGRYLHGG